MESNKDAKLVLNSSYGVLAGTPAGYAPVFPELPFWNFEKQGPLVGRFVRHVPVAWNGKPAAEFAVSATGELVLLGNVSLVKRLNEAIPGREYYIRFREKRAQKQNPAKSVSLFDIFEKPQADSTPGA